MENKKHSASFIKRRKFLMAIPILVFPFVTMGFWAMGGGQGKSPLTNNKATGFNANLPGANLKDDTAMDKMGYYEQAGMDSAKTSELKKNDPYYNNNVLNDTSIFTFKDPALELDADAAAVSPSYKTMPGLKGLGSSNTDHNERQVYEKLDRLNAALAQNVAGASLKNDDSGIGNNAVNSAEIDRLQRMMQSMNQPAEKDPEMTQLEGMLEKLIDVQNPDRVQEKLKQASEKRKGSVFAVTQGRQTNPVSRLDKQDSRSASANQTDGGQQANGFYSFDNPPAITDLQNAVAAVIHETQTLINGSTIKLRLVNDIFINGVLIPKGNFVFGMASLNGDRLSVKIASIRYKNNLFPVELTVFDMDGLEGINIPGAISREVAKESADQGLQNIGLNSLDPSLAMQAASVGIAASKSLLSRKVKLTRVSVKAGYQVLLRDEKQKQD